MPKGFEPSIIKFDGSNDAKGYGRIEHAYHRMALAAGISMSKCLLRLEDGRAHFMTRRFEEAADGPEFFRRMAFNVVARIQDDHVKNISFLMDKSGVWSLSPAYDVTFSQGAGPTSSHQMTINMKSDGFELSDFKTCAKVAGLKQGQAEAILGQVTAVVRRWPEFGEADDVASAKVRRIQQSHRLLIG